MVSWADRRYLMKLHNVYNIYSVYTVLSVFGLVACGGEPSIQNITTGTDETTGTGGSAETSSSSGDEGGGNEKSSSSVGGASPGSTNSSTSVASTTSAETSSSTVSSSNSGTGGSECVPKITCQSVAAECGTIQDDGCGNKVECPNNCSGLLTCGGGGNQFKCGCTPKSCLDQDFECGEATDGCGKKLDCGGCDLSNPYLECGGKPAPNPDGTFPPSRPNICEGGCAKVEDLDYICEFQIPNAFVCSKSLFNPKQSDCVGNNHNGKNNTWCCL